MKPFIPYARVSSDEQKDAETIKTQIAEVEAYARNSNLPLAPEWVTDDGVSGVIPFHERQGGARVLELLRTGLFAGVACLNHKRIGRDAYVIHLAVRQIEQELGGDIQAVREPVPSQLAPGARALMRAMYAGVAEFDRHELLAAMRAGKVRAAREGRWTGGSVPFGLRLEVAREGARTKPTKRLVPDETTAPVVAEVFTLYLEGRSQNEIAQLFNARGTAHPTGERWRQSTVSYILRNPTYKGECVWRRRYEAKNSRGRRSKYTSPAANLVPYEDYKVPAIVTPELWERCAALRRANVRFASRNARHFYLLRGIVKCGLCGRGFNGLASRGRWFYYECNSRVDVNVPRCGNRRVKAGELERLIWGEIVRFAESPGNVLRLLRRAGARAGGDNPATADRVEARILAKRRERERVITWAREGRITEEEMSAQLELLRGEIAALETERGRARESHSQAETARERLRDAEAFLDSLAARIESLADEERARVIRQLVPRAVVTPREDGRFKVAVTYLFAPPSILGNAPLRASL